MREEDTIIAYTDGGSRGNPGPAACAFVIYKNNSPIFSKGIYLSVKTNNEAEYSGLINCLEWLVDNKSKINGCDVKIFMDSELVIKQMNNIYKVKSQTIKIYFEKAKGLVNKLDNKILFVHTKREKNNQADFLVNKTLDEN